MASTLDAESYPHIWENFFCQIHLSGQYRTLAQCRLANSSVKHAIDSRLPRHKILDPLIPSSIPPGGVQLRGNHQTLLWNCHTEGWCKSTIAEVHDLHVQPDVPTYVWADVWEDVPAGDEDDAQPERPSYWPVLQGGSLQPTIPVLRVFDYQSLCWPSGAETLVVFPSLAYFSNRDPRPSHKFVVLCSCAKRIVINMRYDPAAQPIDYAFSYIRDPADPEQRRTFISRIYIVQQPQELVLMLSPVAFCGARGDETGSRALRNWLNSITMALRHNLFLTIVLLAEHWHWEWFTEEESPEHDQLLEIEDEHERLIIGCKRIFRQYLGPPEEIDFESCWARVKFATISEYEAQVGPRMFQLLLSE